jgi:hypothetical protein
MKQNKRQWIVGFMFGLFSLPLYSTTQFGPSCPEKFIGTVINVEDVAASTYPKVEISFQVIQTLKGTVTSMQKIQLVKNGPLEFKTGEVYTVDKRDTWLCDAVIVSAK